jgi:hypothetical protein
MFVPVYRQDSLAGVALGVLTGTGTDFSTGAMDVEDAWNDYGDNYNTDPVTHQRRGVILLGHSQGSSDLAALIRSRIDGHPEQQARLVSAILLGGNIQVPTGRLEGGGSDPDSTFQHVPGCARTSATAPVPTGCVVAYSSYDMADGQTPASNSLFGHSTATGHQILCTSPAALLKGAASDGAQTLNAYLPTSRLLAGSFLLPNGSLSAVLFGLTPPTYATGCARYPDTLTGRCTVTRDSDGNTTSWLQVSGGNALFPTSTRTSGLGLHVLDYNVALGDLVGLATQQSRSWLAAHG